MEASSAPRAVARRHDVDWLRIAAVLLLIPYHTLLVYEVAVRRWGPVRFLLGMKPRRRRESGPYTGTRGNADTWGAGGA